jgi:hypothetical protein
MKNSKNLKKIIKYNILIILEKINNFLSIIIK